MSKKFVVMVGGPAAGKSTVAKQMYNDIPRIDCDEIKKEHADYDPKAPHIVHEWSSIEATRRVLANLSSNTPCVFDSTGTNAEKLSMFVSMAKAAGMTVEACYVTCSIETAIKRNAQRERTVDVNMLREKHAAVGSAWIIVKNLADTTIVVDTN